MKIAFFEIHDWEINILKKKFAKHTLLFYSTPLAKNHLKDISDCDIISVFIHSKINSPMIDKLPKLKLVVTRSTGYDHIDYKECGKRKILVCNIPYYGENTVAEHTFALLLSISRKVHKSYLKAMASDFSIDELKGFDLKGKTIGVVGVGHIGKRVVRIARGFEMNVLAVDSNKNISLSKNLGFSYTSLDNLLKNSDIITLHVPLTKETRHMINASSIKKMKKGVIIINTSRGEVIDTRALLNGLNSGKIAGIGIDVIEGESLIMEEKELLHKKNGKKFKQIIEDLSLIRNENVVFTPHIAFYSQEALERILNTTIEEIDSFIKKKPFNIIKNV